MPYAGDILRYERYQFVDGTERDKLFVVLNAANGQTPCLVLPTTSQPKRYLGAQKGCNPAKRVFFVPKNSEKCFWLDTYIQLPRVIPLSAAQLVQAAWASQVSVTGCLSPLCFAQLKNCLKKFKRDLSQENWDFIFKRRSPRG